MVTLEEVKAFLGIEDNAQDAKLSLLLAGAEAFVAAELGLPVTEVTAYPDWVDGSGNHIMTLTHRNLTETTEFKLEWRGDTEDAWEEVPATEYTVDIEAGVVRSPYSFMRGILNYRATYSYGYTETPGDLKLAILQIVKANITDAAGVASERIGDYSVSYTTGATAAVISSLQAVFDNHRTVDVC